MWKSHAGQGYGRTACCGLADRAATPTHGHGHHMLCSAGGEIWYNTSVAPRSGIGGTVLIGDGRQTSDCGLLPLYHQTRDRIMPRVKFGAFLAPHHPIGEHPMLQFRRDLELVEHLDKLG